MIEQGKLAKVIGGLDACLEGLCEACSYRDVDAPGECKDALMYDAFALLKAQEPVSVQKKQMEMVGLQTWDWACGNCGQTVLFSAKFCPWCGRAVKWQ